MHSGLRFFLLKFFFCFFMIKNASAIFLDDCTQILVDSTQIIDTTKVLKKKPKINPRREKPFGVYGVIYNIPAYSSLALSYFPTSTINIEVGIGILGLYGQLVYHIKGNVKGKNYTAYLGGALVESGNFGTDMLSFYFPIGIKWIGHKGMGISVEIPAFKLDVHIPSLAVKIGYHF